MREHLTDGIDVRAVGNQKRSVGVAETVKGDFLLDACIFEPFLKRLASVGAAQSSEYHAVSRFSAIRQCSIAQR